MTAGSSNASACCMALAYGFNNRLGGGVAGSVARCVAGSRWVASSSASHCVDSNTIRFRCGAADSSLPSSLLESLLFLC